EAQQADGQAWPGAVEQRRTKGHSARTGNRKRLEETTNVSSLAPLINILEPDNIVLAEIAAGLHLDQLERNLAVIGEPVDAADRNVDRLVLMDDALFVTERDFGGAAHHHPMLGAVAMLLQ